MSIATKPRIAIVGAGMAGLSAANRLIEACRTSDGSTPFDLVVVEASNRAGGRILSAEFHGENVESGATWIHGIEGSPIYAIAKQIGAMSDKSKPWEFMDGLPLATPAIAEGGSIVPPTVVAPMVSYYRHFVSAVQKQSQTEINLADGVEQHKIEELITDCRSLGDYLRKGLDKYLEEAAKKNQSQIPSPSAIIAELGPFSNGERSFGAPNWNLRSLQKAVFSTQYNLERCITAADGLDNVDLEAFGEYREFPGMQLPIPRGFSSVVNELVSKLPEGSIMFNARVERIEWCCDGSKPVLLKGPDIEADHVILTVSLGVLKSCIKGCKKNDVDSGKDEADGLSFGGFQPPLPSRKVDAISRLGFGVVDKVHMHFSSSVSDVPSIIFVFRKQQNSDCDDDCETGGIPCWMRKTYSMTPIHNNSRIVASWLAGKEAMQMESLSDQDVIRGMLNTLSAFGFNPAKDSDNAEDKMPVIDAVLRSKWATHPLFWGSYSYVPLGSSGEDIELLAEPLPYPEDQNKKPFQILFAGEATDRNYYSTTHAAFLSGVREANRLLKHYNLP
ncbi:hypothetical protein SUGI_0455660 [Cryptomeria japonica]|uniref:probable polyamine oxidase 5 n=1 Tax=Cryptomeria japonica TaxID=3369 RepID=UPI002408B008|nr:probable polyamine oxidase 5 [Cryptomeria japonica]GLJ23970.1 hypothetical protein SUGI_0455660 [Cryptomeria japonica]